MDCSCAGADGYFEFTAVIEDTRNGYKQKPEKSFEQETCQGGGDVGCSVGEDKVHYARCGFINSYEFGKGDNCWITEFAA